LGGLERERRIKIKEKEIIYHEKGEKKSYETLAQECFISLSSCNLWFYIIKPHIPF
jgi:hypothetical protein